MQSFEPTPILSALRTQPGVLELAGVELLRLPMRVCDYDQMGKAL